MTKEQAEYFDIPEILHAQIKITLVMWDIFTDWFKCRDDAILRHWEKWFNDRGFECEVRRKKVEENSPVLFPQYKYALFVNRHWFISKSMNHVGKCFYYTHNNA